MNAVRCIRPRRQDLRSPGPMYEHIPIPMYQPKLRSPVLDITASCIVNLQKGPKNEQRSAVKSKDDDYDRHRDLRSLFSLPGQGLCARLIPIYKRKVRFRHHSIVRPNRVSENGERSAAKSNSRCRSLHDDRHRDLRSLAHARA